MSARRWWPAALTACAVHLALAWRHAWLCDDAFISFRYARHLAGGRGLAFNPGQAPPAEGYSDLLWVLVLAPFEALGVGAPAAAPVLSALAGCAVVVLCARLVAVHLQAGPLATWSAALFVASLAPMAIWATGGLETMAFALALFALFSLVERPEPSRLALVAGVAATALLRADGPLWAAAVLGAALALGRDPGGRRRAALLGLGALVLIVALHSGFRLAYHGDLVPNTVRVKGGLSGLRLERGLLYVGAYAAFLPVALLVPLGALLAVGRERRGLALRAGALVLFGLAFAALVGGDFLPMGRLLVPTLAPTAVLLALLVGSLAASNRGLALATAAGACLLGVAPLLDLHPVPRGLRESLDFRWSKRRFVSERMQWQRVGEVREELEVLARALNAATLPGEGLVEDAVGVVGYRTELVIHDRFGLVDREVAGLDIPPLRASPGHDRAVEARFFLDRRPDYLEAYLVPAGTPEGSQVSPDLVDLLRAGRARVESHPLPADRGFPENAELRLVRYLPRD